jgi:hypothetical protein
MTSINAVEIVAHVFYVRGDPDSPDPAVLFARPGNIRVGRWDAGILSLQQPDGDRRRVSCPNADEAVREAALTWNTAEGLATLERWIGVQRALATWTGERRHEWQTPADLIALVKAVIKQAVKDGVLPPPNDYRVTWRKSEDTISVLTKHAWLRRAEVDKTLETLLRPFNASTAGDFRGSVIERLDFYIRAGTPNQPREDQTLPAAEIWALRYARRIAAMERDGFAAPDIDHMRATCAKYAPAA